MWFHNLQIYRLPTPWAMTADKLREQLARGIFHPPAGHEAQSRGWWPPRNDGDLVHAASRRNNPEFRVATVEETRTGRVT